MYQTVRISVTLPWNELVVRHTVDVWMLERPDVDKWRILTAVAQSLGGTLLSYDEGVETPPVAQTEVPAPAFTHASIQSEDFFGSPRTWCANIDGLELIVPANYNYVAQDKSGAVFAHEQRPVVFAPVWLSQGAVRYLGPLPPNDNWTETLITRPKP